MDPPDDLEAVPAHDCGYVVVPQDAGDPDGLQVKLSYVRFSSAVPDAEERAPVFLLGGGPGGSQMSPAFFRFMTPGYLGRLLESRDVVLLDQRGTEHTEPSLVCPDYHRLAWFQHAEGLDEEGVLVRGGEILERCVEEAEAAGVDLATFNSVVIASDVDAARRALGYDRIVYYGGSYGSQLGQHVMREFPEILEAVVLDGANSLSRRSWVEDRAIDVDYALGHLAELCAEQPGCAEAYDIPGLIAQGLAMFDAGPLTGTYADPESGETLEIEARRIDFLHWVYGMIGSKYGAPSLPFTLNMIVSGGKPLMAEAMASDLGPKILSQRAGDPGGLASLMHYAVVCSDDPVHSVDDVVIEDGTSPLAREWAQAVAREYVIACPIVDVPALPDETDVDVAVDVPTLLLSGGLDAATPTYRSEIVERALPDARMVVFPAGTHVQLGAMNECAVAIMVSFLDDRSAPLQTDCLSEFRWSGFLMPEALGLSSSVDNERGARTLPPPLSATSGRLNTDSGARFGSS